MTGSPKLSIVVLVALAQVAFVHDVHFKDPASGYRFDAADGGFDSDKVTHLTHFLFIGHAVATSSQLDFRADRIQGILGTPPGAKKAILRHADTKGEATIKRTAKSGELATLHGSRFVFDGDANIGHLAISGPVTITDSKGAKSNLKMHGLTGAAELDMTDQATQSPLRTADLDGSVVVDVIQVGKGAGSVHAIGQHLRLDNTVTPATLTLTGNVAIHGENGNETGDATGIQRVRFLLNKQGEFTHVEAGQTSPLLVVCQASDAKQNGFSYAAKDGSLVISGFEGPYSFSYDALTGDLSASGSGSPARIEFKPSGLSISAENLDVKAARSAAKQFYLVTAHTSGKSETVLDSAVAQAFHKTTGAKGVSRVQLNSDRTEYAGNETDGTLTLPTPFDADGQISGTRIDHPKPKAGAKAVPDPVDFSQVFKLHGASGVMDIDPQPAAAAEPVKSGTFAGPIAFSANRTETHHLDQSQSTFSVTDGHCDSMNFQSGAEAEALSFIGHVQFLLVDNQGRMPVRNGDIFTFHFDPTLAPVSFDGKGSPFEISVPIKTKQR